MIVVDGREASKHKDIIEKLEQESVQIEQDTLQVGDFIVFGKEDTWCFERKTQQDMRSSLLSERGWEQVKALADARDMGFKVAIILESGYIWDKDAGKPLRWETFLKRHPHLETNWYSLSFALAKWQIPIVQTKDAEGTAIFLKYIDESLGKSKEKKEYPMRQGFRKNMSLEDKRLYFWDVFGHECAKSLLSSGGSLNQILYNFLKGLPYYLPNLVEDNYAFPLTSGQAYKSEVVKNIADVRMESGRRIGEKRAEEICKVLFG